LATTMASSPRTTTTTTRPGARDTGSATTTVVDPEEEHDDASSDPEDDSFSSAASSEADDEDDALLLAHRLAQEERESLDARRALEYRLFATYDATAINPRRACWFLVSTAWLGTWRRWLLEEGEMPPAIDNRALFNSVAKNNSGSSDDARLELRPDLIACADYRGVHPMTFFLMKELYGERDEVPHVRRYVVDAYAAELAPRHAEHLREPAFKARALVRDLRGKLHPMNRTTARSGVYEYDSDDSEDDDDDVRGGCCCCGRRRLDCLLYNAVACCRGHCRSRRRAKAAKRQRRYERVPRGLDAAHDEEGQSPHRDEKSDTHTSDVVEETTLDGHSSVVVVNPVVHTTERVQLPRSI